MILTVIIMALNLTTHSYAKEPIGHRLPVETIIENAPKHDNGNCDAWVAGDRCTLENGHNGYRWTRNCDHVWDNTKFCAIDKNLDPNALETVCSEWVEDGTVDCNMQSTNKKFYFRDCQDIRYAIHACLDPLQQ